MRRYSLLTIFAAMALTACGGGGDAYDPEPAPAATTVQHSKAAATTAAPAYYQCSITMYGDSILHGDYGMWRHERFPAAEIRTQRPKWLVDDRSIGGQPMGSLRHMFDYLEDGVWVNYFSEHEHYSIAGVAHGLSEDAPYTHWMAMGPVPAALPPSGAGEKTS